MERIAGTDVWHWSFEVEAEWRGSYCFIPLDDNHLHGARGADGEMTPKDWWRAALKFAQPDSLNPNLCHVGLRGQPLSAAHLPQAPLQTAWRDVDHKRRPAADQSRLHRMEWNSARLRNSRRVWIYRTGATPKESKLPLVVLLDGQYWAEAMPVFSALDHATHADMLPPSVYVLIRLSPPSPRLSKNTSPTRARRRRKQTDGFGWTTPKICRPRSHCRGRARRPPRPGLCPCRCGEEYLFRQTL